MAEFDTVYRQYRQRVYRWALRYSAGDKGSAEDLVQEVFVKLLEALPSLDATDDLGAWFYRVTANLAMYRLRRETRFFKRLSRILLLEAPVRQPDELLALEEETSAVLEVVRRLPPRDRVLISMRYLDGKSGREIAQELGKSEGYVSKLLARAVERVRAQGWRLSDD